MDLPKYEALALQPGQKVLVIVDPKNPLPSEEVAQEMMAELNRQFPENPFTVLFGAAQVVIGE